MTDYTIRPATEADIPTCLEMGVKFHASTDYAAYIPFCRDTVAANGRVCITNGLLNVAERDGELIGIVGLIFGPSIFNVAVLCAYEVMWWVNPEEQATGVGKALVASVEPICKDKGVRAIHMLHLHNSPPQAAALYERLGYHNAESTFIKVI